MDERKLEFTFFLYVSSFSLMIFKLHKHIWERFFIKHNNYYIWWKWDKIFFYFFIFLFLYSQSRISYIILSLIMISYVYINNIGFNIGNTRENVKVLRAQQRMHFYFIFQILEEDDLMKRNIYLFLQWYENVVFKCCLYSILKTFNLYSMDFRKKIK